MIKTSDKFFNFSLVLLLILLSGSILFVGYIIPTFIVGVILGVLSIILRQNKGAKEIRLFSKTFILFVIVMVINFLFSKSNDFGNYVTIIALGFYAFLVKLSFDTRRQNFTYYLYRVLNFIVLYSFVNFLLVQFVPVNLVEFGSTGFAVNTFNFLFFFRSKVSLLGVDIFRNQGFFWEPGILSVFANFFLFLALFKFKERKKTIIAIICIITTFSTTGLFLLVLQLIYSLKTYKISKIKKVLGLILSIPILLLAYYSFSEKEGQSKEHNISSYGIRTYDLYSGFTIAIKNPLFGVGINKEAYLAERDKYFPRNLSFDKYDIEGRATSNGFTKIFFSLGIFLGAFIIYLIYNQNIVTEHKLMFLTVTVINLSTEPLFYTPFFLFIVFSGLQNKLKLT